MAKVKVKGIKFGTFAQYQAITTKDPDTLYFITDRGGTIYRGTSLVIPQKVIENVTQTSVNSIGGVSVSGTNVAKRTFTITAFSSDGSNPTTITFDVYTKEAVDAVITVMKGVMDTHRDCGDSNYADGKANGKTFGHVMLSDSINENSPQNVQDGIAATPRAVYDYVQSQIGGIGGGVVFKGTIGAADTYDASGMYKNGDYCEHGRDRKLYRCIAETGVIVTGTWNPDSWTEIQRTVNSLPSPADGYEAGWEYVVIVPGTYAGKTCEVNDRIMSLNDSSGSSSTVVNDDWTVVQGNIDGAVTAANDLDNNTLVIGNGGKTVKKLSNGTAGQWLRIVDGRPQWSDHPNTDHGIANCTCNTPSSNQVKVASLFSDTSGSFKLVSGAIVSVFFAEAIINDDSNTSVTLNVDGSGAYPICIGDENITTGYIDGGNTATFMFDGVEWAYLAVDKKYHPVATSGDYNDLTNKPIHYLVDNNTASETTRTLIEPSYTDDGKHLLIVKFSNGIVYSSGTTCTLKIKKDSGTSESSVIAEHPLVLDGVNVTGTTIKAGDVATIVFNGTNRFEIVSIARAIDSVPTSGSDNYVTSGGVYSFVQAQIDANALWWEELSSSNN